MIAIERAKRLTWLVMLMVICGCAGRHVLRFEASRSVKVEERPRSLFVRGGTIHSGLCIEYVEQRRTGAVVTLVVGLEPTNLHCSGEFFALISRDAGLREVRIGDPYGRQQGDLGVIWRKR